jgi:hypothetical protein
MLIGQPSSSCFVSRYSSLLNVSLTRISRAGLKTRPYEGRLKAASTYGYLSTGAPTRLPHSVHEPS